MIPYSPRFILPEPPADTHTWRVLLSLPGRVAIIDEEAATDLMRLARATFNATSSDQAA